MSITNKKIKRNNYSRTESRNLYFLYFTDWSGQSNEKFLKNFYNHSKLKIYKVILNSRRKTEISKCSIVAQKVKIFSWTDLRQPRLYSNQMKFFAQKKTLLLSQKNYFFQTKKTLLMPAYNNHLFKQKAFLTITRKKTIFLAKYFWCLSKRFL